MILYALTIVASAFLLFQVQPMLGRIILPWFGGAAGVWTICLLFFQVVLLLGYLYAHALVRYVKPQLHAMVHGAMLLVSLAALPVYPSARWKPGPGDPTWSILALLAATVGLPYFLLSSTGPLLQAWYARRFRDAMPYRLYALSNAGSMFALLSYPVLFEPFFGTHRQAWIWSVGYLVFAAMCVGTAIRSGSFAGKDHVEEFRTGESPGMRRYVMWIALPACASGLLLAITNHLTQNVAPIPFLWVLPLSIYLLTFILCFSGWGRYRRPVYLALLVAALWSMGVLLDFNVQREVPIRLMVPLFAVGLFACCMACHGELVRLQPDPRYLTQFYVSIAAGGAAGGMLVGLVAPRLFRDYYELPILLVLCGGLIVAALFLDGDVQWFRSWDRPAPLVAWTLLLGLAVYLNMQISDTSVGVRLKVRNFYGGLKVREAELNSGETLRKLAHGTINHGQQFLRAPLRYRPTAYYGPNTGVGVAIREKMGGPMRVGVIGLGTGTLAAYGRAGDYYRFYEINPAVTEIARSWFTFLEDSKARLDVVVGDGRFSLEREESQNFDVLAVDAFSGDAIPVHLLTAEAIALYFRHLKPDGILAIHISNRYLDLEPVLEVGARTAGKASYLYDTGREGTIVVEATWVLITAATGAFPGSRPLKPKRNQRPWTDDYSNLFQIMQ